MKPIASTLLLSAIVGLLAGALGSFLVLTQVKPDTDTLIRDFYLTENAVHVSPHSLRTKMMKGTKDFTLVDLRSAQEYEKEHVAGAVNIPAYKDPVTPAYEEVDRIVAAFKALPAGKPVIVYCYSIPCMTGRKVGKMLAENGVYVQHLGIGWNEWRYFWNLWNHEGEWDATDVKDYVATGKQPGEAKVKATGITPCADGQFGC